jgi:hypothetical protein
LGELAFSNFPPSQRVPSVVETSAIAGQVSERKSGLPTIMLRTLAVKNVTAVRTIDVSALTATELIDLLVVVCSGFSGVPDDNLPVRVDVAYIGGAFGFCHEI